MQPIHEGGVEKVLHVEQMQSGGREAHGSSSGGGDSRSYCEGLDDGASLERDVYRVVQVPVLPRHEGGSGGRQGEQLRPEVT